MTMVFAEIPGVEWVETSEDFIRIDREKCQNCLNCYKVCLGDCYQVVDEQVSIRSLEKCMECGACWFACEHDAIVFSWPRGGTGFKTDLG